MQQQHVQTTIRPLVCDLLTTRRALEKLGAQARATDHSLTKRLKRIIARTFSNVRDEATSELVRTSAAWSIRSLESNGTTGPLRLTIDLKARKDLSHEQIELLRALYVKFKEECLATFTSVEKLTLQFEEV